MYLKTSLSPSQLLDLWSALTACYYDEGTHDTNTCEIYFYTLLPSSPFAEKAQGPLGEEEREKREDFAASELANVLAYFCSQMECKVSVYDSNPAAKEKTFLTHLKQYSTRVQITVHRSPK